MNEIRFSFAEEQKDKVYEAIKPYEVMSTLNRIPIGYTLTLSALGGRQDQVHAAVKALESIGFSPY
jgi:hypothetical protein